MSQRALGPQFARLKERATNKALDYISKKVEPIHQAIVRQGEANQPAVDEALANWEKAWRGA